MGFEDLSPELQEKARACKSKEELAELAASVGVYLSDAELEAVAGGDICKKDCPWDGAICRIDTNCITKGDCQMKTSCPAKECTDLFSCIPKNCTNFTNPPDPGCMIVVIDE